MTFTHHLAIWLKSFRPGQQPVDVKEKLRSVLGALIGICVTGFLCRYLAGSDMVMPWLVAPLGASAVLVFAAPASPLAQPWAVVGGNTFSALAGILCCNAINDPVLAGGVAVALAIGVMFQMRCLHPPGGAMALITVLTHMTHFQFAWFPAFTNSTLLVLAGIAYNTLTRRRYPHIQVSIAATQPSRFTSTDLDTVLAKYNQVLDVSRDDLEAILQATEMEAYRRKLGEVRCAEIMSRHLILVDYAAPLQEAWQLMQQHRIKALPVVDKHKRILGIVTLADFMRHANINVHDDIANRLRALIRPTTALHTNKPEVVGQIMTTQVRVVSQSRHIVELLPLFSESGHHHIPVIDEGSHIVGIITQSDLVRALHSVG